MNGILKAALALLLIGALVSLFTLFRGDRPIGSENLIGKPLPGFAAPLATGSLEGDSNVYTAAQAKQVDATPACDVELDGSFNSCESLMKGDAVITFWNPTKDNCIADIDTLDRFAAANKDVHVAAVSFDKPKSDVAPVAAKQGWRIPVAVDRDGAVAGLYAVAGCPTTFFARDGKITGVELGVLSADQLAEGLK